MIRVDSEASLSSTEMEEESSRSSGKTEIRSVARRNRLNREKGTGPAVVATTAISLGELHANDVKLAKMEPKELPLVTNHKEKPARGIGSVLVAITTTLHGEQNASVATPAKMELREQEEEEEVDSEAAEVVAGGAAIRVDEAEEAVVISGAPEAEIPIEEGSTNHSEVSKAKARRQTTRRSSSMIKLIEHRE